jgi:hypothetical protein
VLTEQLEANWLSPISEKYLNIYVAEIDWKYHQGVLYQRWMRSGHTQEEAVEKLRKVIACTVLLPLLGKHRIPDPPESLLYQCSSFHQFTERDWYEELHKIVQEDQKIIRWRNQCQSLGIIDPIDFSPITRQAFNWLFSAAERSGVVTPENTKRIEQSFKRLVYAYGGAVICSVFQKHENLVVKNVVNWRTNYFFEKLIFEVYSIDQVVKIKRQELKKTNPKLVKQIKRV